MHAIDFSPPSRVGVGVESENPIPRPELVASQPPTQAQAFRLVVDALARPFVDLLRLVVKPEPVVELAVELGGKAADAESDAGAFGALVVKIPPGVGVAVALRLQAHAV